MYYRVILRTESRSGEKIGPQFRSKYHNARFSWFPKENSQICFTDKFSCLWEMELRIRRCESLIWDELEREAPEIIAFQLNIICKTELETCVQVSKPYIKNTECNTECQRDSTIVVFLFCLTNNWCLQKRRQSKVKEDIVLQIPSVFSS